MSLIIYNDISIVAPFSLLFSRDILTNLCLVCICWGSPRYVASIKCDKEIEGNKGVWFLATPKFGNLACVWFLSYFEVASLCYSYSPPIIEWICYQLLPDFVAFKCLATLFIVTTLAKLRLSKVWPRTKQRMETKLW
jgi:hypothetical protein